MGKIPDDWRAAIDKAVAEGRVTKVPMGVSGIPHDAPADWKAQRDIQIKNQNRMTNSAVEARRQRISALHAEGLPVTEIIRQSGEKPHTVRNDMHLLGLKANPRPVREPKPRVERRGRKMTADIAGKRERRHAAKAETLKDRRRFKTVPIPFGQVSRLAPADATGTIFPTRVFDVVGHENVLKDGASNAKIGGDVLKGRLKGARIFTLTLEERATCPRSCGLWAQCYGNGMQYAWRWRHGPELEEAIRIEVGGLCAAHEKVLIRLHVLGDFYSLDYLALWARLLDEHEDLHVFGFTAWGPKTEIGASIARVRDALGMRFAIRHSGSAGRWGSFTIDFPTEKARLGDAIICPEQSEAMRGERGRHCGTCALCWQSDAAIVFVEH